MKRIPEFVQGIGYRINKLIKSPKFKRYLPLAVVLVLALGTLVTCVAKTRPEPDPDPSRPGIVEPTASLTPQPSTPSTLPTSPSPDPDPDPDPGPDPDPDPYSGPRNPLTGIPTDADISQKRPLAIMINNISAAQPQVGISRADILYEIPVEGGVTRMLAIFQDTTDVGVIGSIRSARPYYVDIAQSYDAIFIFAGASEQAYTVLRNRNITHLDGVNGRQTQIYYRDPNRAGMAIEHRLVTSGARIAEHFPTYNFRFDLEEGYERALSFAEEGTPESGAPALDFTVSYSSGKSTSFRYNAEEGLYYLSQKMRGFDGPYRDGNDNSQLSVTNVLILQTSVSRIPGDGHNRLRVTTTGDGSGYFVCGGMYVEVNWSRENDSAQFRYTLKDGSDLVLGQGSTYICIVPKEVSVEIS